MSNEDSPMNDQIKARLLKLLALARGGVGGEAENAEQFLRTRLAKHGLTIADLEDAKAPKTEVRLTYKDATDKRLLFQVLTMVTNATRMTCLRTKGRKFIDIELTSAQAAEVSIYMDAYRKALNRHLDNAFVAFVHGNNIYAQAANDPADSKPDQPRHSEEDLKAIRAMLRGVQTVTVHKAIGHATA